jgi:hypothetical protein
VSEGSLEGEWHAAGFAGGTARPWIWAGFDPQRARSWRKAGFSADDALKWSKTGMFTPGRAALWRRACRTIEQAEAFSRKGFDLAEAKVLSQAGMTAALAERWITAGLLPEEAASSFKSGLSLEQAVDRRKEMAAWRRAGFGPSLAMAWRERNFSPVQAVDWGQVRFAPEEAVAWRASGWEPRRAASWRDACGTPERATLFFNNGFGSRLHIAAILCPAGFDPSTATVWLEAGLSPEEAADYFQAGLTLDEALDRQRGAIEEAQRAEAARQRAEQRKTRRLEREAQAARVAAQLEEEEEALHKAEQRELRRQGRIVAQEDVRKRRQRVVSRARRGLSVGSPSTTAQADRLFGSPGEATALQHWSLNLGFAALPRTVPTRFAAGLGDTATRVWRGSGPDRIDPGSVRSLQAILVSNAGDEQTAWATTARRLLYTAATYLVSPAEIALYFDGEPLRSEIEHDIRLPFRSVAVLFGADFWIGRPQLRRLPQWTRQQRSELPYARFLSAARTVGAALSGVILLAGRDDRPADQVGWVVRVGKTNGLARLIVPGSRSRSLLGPILGNLDAAICWAGWDPTDDSPPAVRTAHRAMIAKRPASRSLPQGTIQIRRRQRRRYVDSGVGPAKSSHARRGHWRRQRIGPRDAWHYEYRWIHPTIVGGHLPPDTPGRVYRLSLS